LADNSILSLYIDSYYWGIQTMVTVGYGDIVPISNSERIFASTYMVIGVILYSFVIDNINQILINID